MAAVESSHQDQGTRLEDVPMLVSPLAKKGFSFSLMLLEATDGAVVINMVLKF